MLDINAGHFAVNRFELQVSESFKKSAWVILWVITADF